MKCTTMTIEIRALDTGGFALIRTGQGIGKVEGFEPTRIGLAAALISATEYLEQPAAKLKAVVEVSGGVAEVTTCPDGVEVEIIDHDNEEAERDDR